ncbi:MAG: hypothetical protein ACRDQA_13680, partial [Nocardioidaceae bacterium]
VTPQLLRPGDPTPARGKLSLWSDAFRTAPTVHATQNGTVVSSRRLPWPAAPGRVFRVPAQLVKHADPEAGPIVLRLC